MSVDNPRLSVPSRVTALPREISDGELSALIRVADALCPGDVSTPLPSALPGYPAAVAVALRARSDAFEAITATLCTLPSATAEDLLAHLRQMHDEHPESFQPLAAVVAGAYLLIPEISAAIGYAGQRRNYPAQDDIVDDLADGILDPVIERGPRYVEA